MTKDKIIEDALMRIQVTDGTNEIGDYMSMAADSWAKIQSIAFAQWLMKNYESTARFNIWYGFKKVNGKPEIDGEYTTEELFTLFLNQDQTQK